MTSVLLVIILASMVASGVAGFFLGRYYASLVEQIQALRANSQAPKLEPTKPVIVGGAYEPPKTISTTVSNAQGAGIVETKTPERLEWEHKNELAALEHSS